jgi:hypothetical protein
MKSKWNDGIMSRGRRPIAVLVTADGQPHRFTGTSIPGVCHAVHVGYEKKGKWSNSTYELLHHDTTAFVSWYEDWDTGEVWPQSSWEEAYRFLATKAPALKPELFAAFVRQHWPKAAEKFDAVAAAEAEFGKPSTAEQLAAIEAAKAEVARLNAEAKAASERADELARLTREVRWAREARDKAAARLAEVQAEAASLAGLDPATLNAETDAIWREVRQLEEKIAAASRKAEAEKKKAELGNSLAHAFEKLGM